MTIKTDLKELIEQYTKEKEEVLKEYIRLTGEIAKAALVGDQARKAELFNEATLLAASMLSSNKFTTAIQQILTKYEGEG